MLQAGSLNRRVTLQSLVLTRGSSGGMVKTWVALVQDLPAAVLPLSGNERAASSAGGQVAVARTEFTIRYRADVSEKCRVLYGGDVYNITHVKDYRGRREFLILTCDAGGNDG